MFKVRILLLKGEKVLQVKTLKMKGEKYIVTSFFEFLKDKLRDRRDWQSD